MNYPGLFVKLCVPVVLKNQKCVDCLKFTKNTPLCSILSMTGSALNELAKYLSFILQPVLYLHVYSTNFVIDSFTFARTICNLILKDTFFCSFHISSFFTNVLLDETNNICAKALNISNLTPPSFSKNTCPQLLYGATKSVKFSFDIIMYQQIDGVSMGTPLVLLLHLFL